jgi:hypothetical protein
VDDDDDDGDEYTPVWPSGLWATSQGGETSKAYGRTYREGYVKTYAD